MLEIRNYQTSDFSQVQEILKMGGLYWGASDNEEALERKIKQNPDSILVALEDGKIIGTQFIIKDFLPLMFRLSVHPDFRNKGVGKELMRRGEEILKQKGYNHVNILVGEDDDELQKYYKKQGYEKGNKYVWMVKNL